jgi:hypothetical protein
MDGVREGARTDRKLVLQHCTMNRSDFWLSEESDVAKEMVLALVSVLSRSLFF